MPPRFHPNPRLRPNPNDRPNPNHRPNRTLRRLRPPNRRRHPPQPFLRARPKSQLHHRTRCDLPNRRRPHRRPHPPKCPRIPSLRVALRWNRRRSCSPQQPARWPAKESGPCRPEASTRVKRSRRGLCASWTSVSPSRKPHPNEMPAPPKNNHQRYRDLARRASCQSPCPPPAFLSGPRAAPPSTAPRSPNVLGEWLPVQARVLLGCRS